MSSENEVLRISTIKSEGFQGVVFETCSFSQLGWEREACKFARSDSGCFRVKTVCVSNEDPKEDPFHLSCCLNLNKAAHSTVYPKNKTVSRVVDSNFLPAPQTGNNGGEKSAKKPIQSLIS